MKTYKIFFLHWFREKICFCPSAVCFGERLSSSLTLWLIISPATVLRWPAVLENSRCRHEWPFQPCMLSKRKERKGKNEGLRLLFRPRFPLETVVWFSCGFWLVETPEIQATNLMKVWNILGKYQSHKETEVLLMSNNWDVYGNRIMSNLSFYESYWCLFMHWKCLEEQTLNY